MSQRLMLDEDSQAYRLLEELRAAGHDVLTVREAALEGQSDENVLRAASAERRILLTRNCGDFLALHQADSQHPGILAVYEDADRTKNMSYRGMVQAIGNLEATGQSFACQFIILNHWVY